MYWSPPFVADECFELGRHAYNSMDYYHTVLWMTEALAKVDEEDDVSESLRNAKRSMILDYLSFAVSQVFIIRVAK